MSLVDHDSLTALTYDTKISFCFIHEVCKIFNVFRMRACVNIKESQNPFMVKFIKSLNSIIITILTGNDGLNAFIVLKREIIEFIKEIN